MRGLILSLLFVSTTVFAQPDSVDKYTYPIIKVAEAEFSNTDLRAEFIEFATLALQVKNPLEVTEEVEAERAILEKWYRMPTDADSDTLKEYYVLMLASMHSRSLRRYVSSSGRLVRRNKHERMLAAFYYSIGGRSNLVDEYLQQVDTTPILNNCDEICTSLKIFDLYMKQKN